MFRDCDDRTIKPASRSRAARSGVSSEPRRTSRSSLPGDAQSRFAQRVEIAIARSRAAGHDAEAVDIVGGELFGAAQQRIRVIERIDGGIRLMMR